MQKRFRRPLVVLGLALAFMWTSVLPASAVTKNIVDDCVSGYLKVVDVGGGKIDVVMKASSGFYVSGRTTIFRNGDKYRTKWSEDYAFIQSNIRHEWNDLWVGHDKNIRVTAYLTGIMANMTCNPDVTIRITTD